MSKPIPGNSPPGPGAATDPATPEQVALLRYLGLSYSEETTRAQAGKLISHSESYPTGQEKLQAWERDKFRLHPELFAVAQRSFREARWWQAKISDDTLYGYSFRQPSLDQTFVILDALDRRELGWDREGGKRREARFMNELATLSPELCKPDCIFPHELPANDASEETPAAPAAPAPSAPSAPSAPFVPSQYAVSAPSYTPPNQPAWQPPVQPPAPGPLPERETQDAPAGGGGVWKWACLLALLAAGAGAYFFYGYHPPTLERGGTKPSAAGPSPSAAPATLVATASRQRAVAKYPDLARAGTALNAKFVVTFRDLEAAHDPLLQQPDWPERLADRCANALSTKPTAPRNPPTAPTPAVKPQAAATPSAATPPAVVPTAAVTSPAAAASSTPLPSASIFVALEASYKTKVNTVKYHQHGAPQQAGVAVDVHSMMHSNVKFVLRCVFFKRPNGRGDLRTVLSKEDKTFEMVAGQTYSDVFDSPPVYRGRGATEEFDGWLVQLVPEGSDKFFKQVGSTGTIEELGKRMKF